METRSKSKRSVATGLTFGVERPLIEVPLAPAKKYNRRASSEPTPLRPCVDVVSVKSVAKTVASVNSVRLQSKELELEANKKLHEKEKDMKGALDEVDQAKLEVDAVKQRLEYYKKKENPADDVLKTIEDLELKLIDAELKSNQVQARVNRLQEEFEREKKLIQEEKDLQLTKIMELEEDDNRSHTLTELEEEEFYKVYADESPYMGDEDYDDIQEAHASIDVMKRRLQILDKRYKKKGLSDPEVEEMQQLKYQVIPNAKERLQKLQISNNHREHHEDSSRDVEKASLSGPETDIGKLAQALLLINDVDKDLPSFDGNPAKWGEFYGAYQRTNQKFGFGNDQNLSRLRKSLTGKAKESVDEMFASPDNVPQIMKTLSKEYGNPKRIIKALLSKAEGIKPIDTWDSEALVRFGKIVVSLVSTAKSLGQQQHLQNPYLLDKLVVKLPKSYKSRWIDWINKEEEDEDLLTFSFWLDQRVETARQMQYYSDDQRPEKNKNKFPEARNDRNQRRNPGGAFAVLEEVDKNRSKLQCSCCGKEKHGVDRCFKFGKMNMDERWEFVKKAGICFVCLRQGHRIQDCERKKLCTERGCNKPHHKLLHRHQTREVPETRKDLKENQVPVSKKTEEENEVVSPACSQDAAPLHIVRAYVYGPNGKMKIYVMLDSGATRTLVKEEIATALGIKGEVVPTSFTVMGGGVEKFDNSMRIDFEVKGCYTGAKSKTVTAAATVPKIGIPPQSLDVDQVKRRFPHLRKAQLKSYQNAEISVIIGNDNFNLISGNRKINGDLETDPVAVRSPLGWTIGGRIGTCSSNSAMSIFVAAEVTPSTDESLHTTVKEFFALENMGIKEYSNSTSSIQDKRAMGILQDTAVLKEDRWEIGMLWKQDSFGFPPSYEDALRRLRGIEKKMDRDPAFASLYSKEIEEYITKDFVRKLSKQEAEVESERVRYIPHFGVTNPNKPGKFRLVFDAAARSGGVCLNDELLKGPDLNRPLINVLMNFRRYPVVLMADIADMFHCIKVKKEDLSSQRFLWRGMERKEPPSVYEIIVEIFGATCSPTQAIYVKNLNADRFVNTHPEAVHAIKNEFYVDDYLGGADTVEQAIQLQRDITMINEKGGFKICKWTSNSKEVIESIPVEIRADGVKEIGKSQQEISPERVLGITWNPSDDCFTFLCNFHKVKPEILNGSRPTKRQVAGFVMSLYDPLGFVANVKVKGLMILQSCWNSGIGWDETVTDDIYQNWRKFLSALEVLREVRVPRLYSSQLGIAENVQLHTFVDASLEAYCAVSYLRIGHEDNVDVSLVAAKARVAPIKKTTVPKLELQVALMGTRLAETVKSELGTWIRNEFYWSDSAVVLQWIRSESKRHKMFEANRISEIQEKTNTADWRWVPTSANISDQGTRLDKKISIEDMNDWTLGPTFLYLSVEKWPKEKSPCVVGVVKEIKNEVEFSLPDPSRFSNYFRMIRATAAVRICARIWIDRALKNKLHKKMINFRTLKDDTTLRKLIWPIRKADFEEAVKSQIVKAQHELFASDLQLLKEGKPAKILKKLSPYIDEDGILRIHGRIDKALNAVRGLKRPIILPKRCPFTDLLVDEEHKRNGHFGQETILNQIRQQFWIIDGRAEVKRAALRCNECKIRKAAPIIPEMSPLPASRLADGEPPFTHTGVDLFGPLEVTVKRSREKRWGIIWTCMVTRAVFLDLVNSPSTDQFMMALTRFVGMMRRPQHLYSDNGTNFRGADKELKEALQEMKTGSEDMLQAKGLEWHFNPPLAPHMGGCWERLVCSVKTILKNLLKETYPADRTLLTLLAEITYTLNCRPITFVSSDSNDEEALTPNHFLRGGTDVISYGGSVPGVFTTSDEVLKKQWRRAQVLADHFWNRWRKEYLPTLLVRETWHEKRDPIKTGAVVIVIQDNQPRNTWSKGIITKTFPDSAGNVRTVEVKIGQHLYIRPVTKICPLGITCSEEFGA